VIKTVGKLLKSNVRATDIVARYGGDELALMLIEANTKSAHQVAIKLKDMIGNHTFQWQKKQLSVTVSIGLAMAPAPGIQRLPIWLKRQTVPCIKRRKQEEMPLLSSAKPNRHEKAESGRPRHLSIAIAFLLITVSSRVRPLSRQSRGALPVWKLLLPIPGRLGGQELPLSLGLHDLS